MNGEIDQKETQKMLMKNLNKENLNRLFYGE